MTKNEGILDDKSRAHKENNKYFFNDEFDEALMTLLAFNLIVWSGCVCVCVWVWVQLGGGVFRVVVFMGASVRVGKCGCDCEYG